MGQGESASPTKRQRSPYLYCNAAPSTSLAQVQASIVRPIRMIPIRRLSMRIDGSTANYSVFSTQKKSVTTGSAFADSLGDFDQPVDQDTSGGDEDGGSYDFTHMTPAEMRDL